MFGMFKKTFKSIMADGKKIQNRDLMEGSVAVALLVAYADGDCSGEELLALESSITNNPSLSHFGAELGKTLDSYKGMMDAGITLGKIKLKREIMDCASNENDKMEVFAVGVDIAMADGEICDKEMAVLTAIAKDLGINMKDFGLA